MPLIDRGKTGDVEEARVNATIAPAAELPALPTQADGALVLEGHYAGKMDMAADSGTVGRYLNSHRGWFTRCAHPMQVEPLSDHGYALVVGHFSVLGYEVEPKVGLYLSPLDHQVYRIDTMPIAGYVAPGYDVDFHAVLRLQDMPEAQPPATALTQVDWELGLAVKIHMPRMLNSVPRSLLKTSGDRLLNQVVRQVSKRLTRKVQEDFHQSHGLPLPESYRGHHFWSNWGRRSGGGAHEGQP
ncbi:DUF1997 domain-containing protein [Nodosilinea sp. PGN35]